MTVAPVLPTEEARLASLHSYSVLDTPFEDDYDDLCRLAAAICDVPIALISLVDRDRQWFKSVVGLDTREIDRNISFCAHALWSDGIFEVPDALADQRFVDNPLVTGHPDIRFYAGQPLKTPEGHALGTLCTIDRQPRTLDARQRSALAILAKQVVAQLQLRKAARDLQRLNADKDKFFSIIAHDLRSPFSGLLGLIDLLKDEVDTMDPAERTKFVTLLHGSLHQVHALTENLLKWAQLEQGAMGYHPERLSAAEVFEEALGGLAEALRVKQLTVEGLPDPALTLVGDRAMVVTALRNLLSNAVKYSPSGSTVVLGAVRTDEGIRLSVTDRGQGLSPRSLEALKNGDRLVSSPGTRGEKGSGLGLTLVRQFAARHGGRFEASSVPGSTTATLVLP